MQSKDSSLLCCQCGRRVFTSRGKRERSRLCAECADDVMRESDLLLYNPPQLSPEDLSFLASVNIRWD